MRHAVKLAVLSILLWLTLACTANRQYTEPAAPDQGHHALQENPRDCAPPVEGRDAPPIDCRLAVIEFDDQGSFWHPEQLERAKREIGERSRHDPASELDERVIVIAFIHGWNHDARPTDKNLRSFDGVLGDVARLEYARSQGPRADPPSPRPIVGVFLSWRGQALKVLNVPLSFYNRKAAAERVARVSASHAIHRLVAETKGAMEGTGIGSRPRLEPAAPGEESPRDGNPKSVFVVVGHSFGGLILENTLLRSLTQETNDFSRAFPADLAVLVNPANEAILARQSVEALRNAPPATIEREGRLWSGPGVVSVTSSGDRDTKRYFRWAQVLKSSFQRLRPRQRLYYTHTPGHTTPADGLISHRIRCIPGGEGPDDCPGAPATADEWSERNDDRSDQMAVQARVEDSLYPKPRVTPGECERAAERNRGLCCIQRIEFDGVPRDERTFQRYQVDRLTYQRDVHPDERNRTIYWTLRLPKRIVPNHGEIFDSEFRSLLGALIMLKQGNFEVATDDPAWESACEVETAGP